MLFERQLMIMKSAQANSSIRSTALYDRINECRYIIAHKKLSAYSRRSIAEMKTAEARNGSDHDLYHTFMMTLSNYRRQARTMCSPAYHIAQANISVS